MSSLAKLKLDRRVEFVDDERDIGNGIIVSMYEGWTLDPFDRYATVFGEDTVKECWETLRTAKRYKAP